ncbi:flagellin [Reinekea marina]|uniref:Flagellin n=1 Tax=Reinekea marina TaxID=1310421 RepID=A0ABV7WRY0_9GAMM|nr:flagellin [Reinekea marina]MDN3649232.1 flagellin [Reinekea marina]
MPQIINTNIASLTAQRNLNSSQSANSTALERLSSGLRINSAKDDAAGLAISTNFESQVKGLNVAIRNAGDGISLAQTAEGALGAMTENLQRIRELAVQSSNATNSDDDRVKLQAEVKQLMAEVTRTADETNFNGRNLLDGSFEGTFQIGADAGQTVDVKISELTAEKLGTSSQAGVSSYSTGTAIGNGDLVINGETIRASVAGDDQLSFGTKRSASAIAKAAAINESSDQTNVVATANENVMSGSQMVAGTTATATAASAIVLNGVSISLEGTANATEADLAATRGSVIESINAQSGKTGVIASDGGNNGGVTLTAEDGRNITITSTVNDLAAFGLKDSDTTAASAEESFASVTLTAQDSQTNIVIDGGNGTGNGDISNTGFAAGEYGGQISSTTTQESSQAWDTDAATTLAASTTKALQDGDLVINNVAIRASSSLDDTSSYADAANAASSYTAASGIAIAAAINDSTDQTGVTATVNATTYTGVTTGAATTGGTAGDTLDLRLNGVSITLTETGDYEKNKANAITAINEKSGQTGVVAEDNGKSLTLTAADGRNITMFAVTPAANAGDENEFGLEGVASGVVANVAQTSTYYSTVSLSSASAFEVSVGSNGIAGLTDSGFQAGSFGGGEDGQYLADVDISTFEGAQSAITAIDNALSTVASQRAELGALQNRFESTSSNLQITSENLSAANSRIRDADFAAETAELSRTQVLQQAGISILAQANQRPQQVLSLLG